MSLPRRRFLAVPLVLAAAGAGGWAVAETRDAGKAAGSDREGAGEAAAGPGAPEGRGTSVPFISGAGGYNTYRIPAVLRTGRGTLIAFAEAREAPGDGGSVVVVSRRSTDGGRTWDRQRLVTGDGEDTRGNPAPVVDPASGDVVLLTCSNAVDASEVQILSGDVDAERTRRVWVQRSEDDGRSFSAPSEITADVKRDHWRWYATGPGHAVALTRGAHRGRLVVPANHSVRPPAGSSDTGAEPKYYGGHCCYSDDGGHTWRVGFSHDSGDGVLNPNESTAAQLPDGRIYFNARNQHGTGHASRVDAYSDDGGRTLVSAYHAQPGLVGPVVEGSLLQLSNGPLLFSGPGHPTARRAMTVRASTDGGHTWRKAATLSDLPAGYSDLVEIAPGEVGLLYEAGPVRTFDTIAFARIPLSDLLPG